MQVIKEFEYWEYNLGSKEKKYIGVRKIKINCCSFLFKTFPKFKIDFFILK